jgi:hypothetical protein
MSETVWVGLEEFVEGIDFVVTDSAATVPAEVQLETFRDYLEEQFEAASVTATEEAPLAIPRTSWWERFYSMHLDTCFWSCCLRPIAYISEGLYQVDNPHLFVV